MLSRDDLHSAADRRRARRPGAAGGRRRRPARRRRDGAVHRPVPQGGDRRRSTTPSCARSRSGCATCASSRSGGPRSSSRSARQGKLDDALEAQILAADSKARLEDIYLPYKPKRRTKAQIAREAGLEPLADLLLGDPTTDPPAAAAAFVDTEQGVADAAAALDGARAILVERFAEDADLIGELREQMWTAGPPGLARSATGKEDRGRQVRRLLRLRRAVHQAALAPDPRDVPRREGGGPRPHPGAARPTPEAPCALRGRDRRPLRHRRPGPPGRQVADRHGALGLAHPHPRPPRHRPADAAVAGGRGRGGPRLRGQPARPAARRAGRHPRHDGPRPGLPHRRQGRRGRRDRQGRRHRTRSTRTCRRTSGTSRSPILAALADHAQGRADRDRQRHRLAGDRQAGRRPDQDGPRS